MLPDLYIGAPAVQTYDWLGAYYWKWTPLYLGSESALPLFYGIEGILTRAGILGANLQAILIIPLTTLSALVIWHLAEDNTDSSWAALVAPILYLLGPNLFELLFDGSSDFFLYALMPLLAFLTLGIVRNPSWRKGLALGIVLGFNCAFEPFAPILTLPFVLILTAGLLLVRPWSRSSLFSAGLVLLAYAIAALLNAPYYLGNFGYLTTTGVSGAFEAEAPLVMVTYSWSGPVNLLSLLGGSLYPRYAEFYPAFATSLLMVVPALAMASLAKPLASRNYDLRAALGIQILMSVAWVSATGAGLTFAVFSAIPQLLVFNYPQVFYLCMGFAFALLATFGVDDLAAVAERSAHEPATKRLSGVEPRSSRLVGATLRPILLRTGWIIATAVLVVSVAVPASFYLSTGDMRIDAAPAAAGFPPAWGAHEPASFADINQFLTTHGGDSGARVLLLPAAAFAGGGTLPGYSMNLFNQPEYTGGYTGPFFAAEPSEEYTTEVLNYLVSNRTDLIGIPLGTASVRWVVVDRELNFTGPPRWYLGSMIGDPIVFISLLNQQKDLHVAFQDQWITAYENDDYSPYVQAYPGVTLVTQGLWGNVPIRQAYRWHLDVNNWSRPVSLGSPSDIEPLRSGNVSAVDGYVATGPGAEGNLTIRFTPNTTWPAITATSSRFDTEGVYVTSVPVPVLDQEYLLEYDMEYEGPRAHEGGFLFVAGLDARSAFLWQTDYCCAAPVGKRTVQIAFDPYLKDPRTAFIRVALVFPYRFGSAVDVGMSATNVTLGITPRPPPGDLLSPLLLRQLPDAYGQSENAIVLSRNLSAVSRETLSSSGLLQGELCLGVCPSAAPGTSDQLLFPYDTLAFPATVSDMQRIPESVSGTGLTVNGTAEGNLSLSGSAFQTVYIRARGNGTLAMDLASGASRSISVRLASFAWYTWALSTASTDTSIRVSVSGLVTLDTFLLAGGGSNGTGGTLREASSWTQLTPVQYAGVLTGTPGVLMLAQGFNPGWELQTGIVRLSPVPLFGWANGFLLPGGGPTATAAPFQLVFTGQGEHQALIAVQLVTGVATVSLLLWPGVVRSWKRARSLWPRGGQRRD